MSATLQGLGTALLFFLAVAVPLAVNRKERRAQTEALTAQANAQAESVIVATTNELIQAARQQLEAARDDNKALSQERDNLLAWATATRNAIEVHMVAERARFAQFQLLVHKCEQLGAIDKGTVSLESLPPLYVQYPLPALDA